MQYIAPFPGCTWRIFPRTNGMHRDRPSFRRSVETGGEISPDVAAAAAARGPRSPYPGDGSSCIRGMSKRAAKLNGRTSRAGLVPALADHRNPGQRRVGLYSDQNVIRLPTARYSSRPTCFSRALVPPSTSACRFVARRIVGADQGERKSPVKDQGRNSRSIAKWRRFAQFGSDLDASKQRLLTAVEAGLSF